MGPSDRQRHHAPSIAVALAAVLSACGGGSSGSNPNPQGDLDAPLAAIQFPPSGVLTDAAEVNLVIAAADDTGVASVRVAGHAALRGSDSLWRASVPLSPGDNVLSVETRDTFGNEQAQAAGLVIRREGELWIEPSAIAFDTLADRVLVLDPASSALFGVAPGTGARTLLSGPGRGLGQPMLDARDVDFVAGRNAAVVTDGNLDAVFLVGLATGVRAPLSGAGAGSGPALLDPQGIAVDEARNRVLVLDAGRSELTAIDLTTGARFTLASDSVGSGPALAFPQHIALDPSRNRALVTVRFFSTGVLAVDLATGDRTLLSGSGRGTGPSFVAPLDVHFDPIQDRLLVADPGAAALFEVDPITGARAILSSPSQGAGPTLLRPTGVVLDPGGMPLLVDSALDAVVEVGAMTGDRRILTRVAWGAGPQLSRPSGLASGLKEPDRLAVADESGVLAVELANGARTLITGLGPPFSQVAPVDVVVSTLTPAECLTMLDAGRRAVVDVNRFNGGQTLISGPGVGVGPAFGGPRRMALEPGATLRPCASSALVADKPFFDPGSILRVDFATGGRSVLSGAGHGVGPPLNDPVAIEVDGILEVAHVLDAGSPPQILAIDLASGDRTQVFAFAGQLAGPTDLAFERARGSFTQGRFLITLADAPAVVAASTTLPSMTTVSDALTGSGPLLGRPVALELLPSATVGQVPSRPIAYVADALRGAILAVDTVTGDRVIVSK